MNRRSQSSLLAQSDNKSDDIEKRKRGRPPKLVITTDPITPSKVNNKNVSTKKDNKLNNNDSIAIVTPRTRSSASFCNNATATTTRSSNRNSASTSFDNRFCSTIVVPQSDSDSSTSDRECEEDLSPKVNSARRSKRYRQPDPDKPIVIVFPHEDIIEKLNVAKFELEDFQNSFSNSPMEDFNEESGDQDDNAKNTETSTCNNVVLTPRVSNFSQFQGILQTQKSAQNRTSRGVKEATSQAKPSLEKKKHQSSNSTNTSSTDNLLSYIKSNTDMAFCFYDLDTDDAQLLNDNSSLSETCLRWMITVLEWELESSILLKSYSDTANNFHNLCQDSFAICEVELESAKSFLSRMDNTSNSSHQSSKSSGKNSQSASSSQKVTKSREEEQSYRKPLPSPAASTVSNSNDFALNNTDSHKKCFDLEQIVSMVSMDRAIRLLYFVWQIASSYSKKESEPAICKGVYADGLLSNGALVEAFKKCVLRIQQDIIESDGSQSSSCRNASSKTQRLFTVNISKESENKSKSKSSKDSKSSSNNSVKLERINLNEDFLHLLRSQPNHTLQIPEDVNLAYSLLIVYMHWLEKRKGRTVSLLRCYHDFMMENWTRCSDSHAFIPFFWDYDRSVQNETNIKANTQSSKEKPSDSVNSNEAFLPKLHDLGDITSPLTIVRQQFDRARLIVDRLRRREKIKRDMFRVDYEAYLDLMDKTESLKSTTASSGSNAKRKLDSADERYDSSNISTGKFSFLISPFDGGELLENENEIEVSCASEIPDTPSLKRLRHSPSLSGVPDSKTSIGGPKVNAVVDTSPQSMQIVGNSSWSVLEDRLLLLGVAVFGVSHWASLRDWASAITASCDRQDKQVKSLVRSSSAMHQRYYRLLKYHNSGVEQAEASDNEDDGKCSATGGKASSVSKTNDVFAEYLRTTCVDVYFLLKHCFSYDATWFQISLKSEMERLGIINSDKEEFMRSKHGNDSKDSSSTIVLERSPNCSMDGRRFSGRPSSKKDHSAPKMSEYFPHIKTYIQKRKLANANNTKKKSESKKKIMEIDDEQKLISEVTHLLPSNYVESSDSGSHLSINFKKFVQINNEILGMLQLEEHEFDLHALEKLRQQEVTQMNSSSINKSKSSSSTSSEHPGQPINNKNKQEQNRLASCNII